MAQQIQRLKPPFELGQLVGWRSLVCDFRLELGVVIGYDYDQENKSAFMIISLVHPNLNFSPDVVYNRYEIYRDNWHLVFAFDRVRFESVVDVPNYPDQKLNSDEQYFIFYNSSDNLVRRVATIEQTSNLCKLDDSGASRLYNQVMRLKAWMQETKEGNDAA